MALKRIHINKGNKQLKYMYKTKKINMMILIAWDSYKLLKNLFFKKWKDRTL